MRHILGLANKMSPKKPATLGVKSCRTEKNLENERVTWWTGVFKTIHDPGSWDDTWPGGFRTPKNQHSARILRHMCGSGNIWVHGSYQGLDILMGSIDVALFGRFTILANCGKENASAKSKSQACIKKTQGCEKKISKSFSYFEYVASRSFQNKCDIPNIKNNCNAGDAKTDAREKNPCLWRQHVTDLLGLEDPAVVVVVGLETHVEPRLEGHPVRQRQEARAQTIEESR